MIKESKYIIRRILIGVGIVLVLGLLNGCKVKAYESVNMTFLETRYDSVSTNSENILLQTVGTKKVYYNPNTKYFYNCFYQNQTNCIAFKPSDYFTFDSFGFQIHNSSALVVQYYFTNNGGTLPIFDNTSSITPNFMSNTLQVSIKQYEQSACTGSNNETGIYFTGYRTYYNYYSTIAWTPYSGRSATIIDSPLISPSPTIESLQPLKVNQDSYIVAYIFRPKFSSFDTDNFIYQYRVGKNGSWLNISQNEEQLTINNNNNIYFRILDKSNNELVDSQTFTITDIGTLDNNINYSIDFSTDYETLENTNIISKYFVNINYLPKSSILKYQYQFVLDGSSLDNNNWVSLDSEVFSYNFETTLNGTLYARILDSDDNVLTTGTFTITEIGKFAINNNDKKNKNFFDKISSSINFSGPISGIINIPINLIRVLSSAIASNTCTNYNLGSLWGTNLVIPCVNIKQHLGNSLYSTIDLICACVMIYYIFKMFGELYTNLLFMHKNPIQDLGRRGD